MKKIILVILIWLLVSSCNKYIVTNVYQQKYSYLQEQNAYTDVYSHLRYYGADSIPLENWIENDFYTDTIQIEQKTVLKPINDKSIYTFVFSKYIYPSTVYYNFLIRFSGKKKDLK